MVLFFFIFIFFFIIILGISFMITIPYALH